MLTNRRTACFTVAVLCLSLCATALAAHPHAGATYSGQIRQTFKHIKTVNLYPISFKVTKSGKRVKSFAVPGSVPIYCQGGGFGSVSGGSASVSKGGTFKLKLPIIFGPSGAHQGFATITGTFHAHGKESGRFTTHLSQLTQCNGSSPYSTTAK